MNIHSIYRPIFAYFRAKRMQRFVRLFDISESTSILDVGGSGINWSFVPVAPRLTILNLLPRHDADDEHTWVIADGTKLPFRDSSFDVIFSNSTIEHLGNRGNQVRFAEEIARVGRSYFIQTPNRWFPVEPHLLTPLIHFLPTRLQRRLLRNFTVWGLLMRPTQDECNNFLDEVRLLDRSELEGFFPSGDVIVERFLGTPKSLIAVRR